MTSKEAKSAKQSCLMIFFTSDSAVKDTDTVREKILENDNALQKNMPIENEKKIQISSNSVDVPPEKSIIFHKCKFKEERFKILPRLDHDSDTGIAKCRTFNLFPDLTDCKSKVPLKLETFKKHDKSFQQQKCLSAEKPFNSQDSTPFALCLRSVMRR